MEPWSNVHCFVVPLLVRSSDFLFDIYSNCSLFIYFIFFKRTVCQSRVSQQKALELPQLPSLAEPKTTRLSSSQRACLCLSIPALNRHENLIIFCWFSDAERQKKGPDF